MPVCVCVCECVCDTVRVDVHPQVAPEWSQHQISLSNHKNAERLLSVALRKELCKMIIGGAALLKMMRGQRLAADPIYEAYVSDAGITGNDNFDIVGNYCCG